jgi:hypothetical protein
MGHAVRGALIRRASQRRRYGSHPVMSGPVKKDPGDAAASGPPRLPSLIQELGDSARARPCLILRADRLRGADFYGNGDRHRCHRSCSSGTSAATYAPTEAGWGTGSARAPLDVPSHYQAGQREPPVQPVRLTTLGRCGPVGERTLPICPPVAHVSANLSEGLYSPISPILVVIRKQNAISDNSVPRPSATVFCIYIVRVRTLGGLWLTSLIPICLS